MLEKKCPEESMQWHLVYTKPRQENWALENLQRQGYQCYLPTIPSEKLCQGRIALADEPLFPRYFFIRLGQGLASKSWRPIRSTKGVSWLVSFGGQPARVDESLIELLRKQEAMMQAEPERLFNPGERVRLIDAPFAGIEGIYQISDGERRAMVLIEILGKSVAVGVGSAGLRKVS